MQNYVQIQIPVAEAALRELLVAQLAEAGFDGFEENDDALLAFCSEDVFDEAALQQLLIEHNLAYNKTIILPQNWNEVWESNFKPVVIDGFVAVRAAFHQPVPGVPHEIVITPKMSFGTGHHATTYMMMQQMRLIDFAGKTIFDFGTGTGILAILAKMLGAENVTAIDIDEWSITNAQENFDNNNISGIRLIQEGNPAAIDQTFNIIVANINKNVLLQCIPVLATQLTSDGYLLLSGLLAHDEEDILLKASQNSLVHLKTISRDKWICLLLQA
jgi:ribosomal protein L11 methyltransferase